MFSDKRTKESETTPSQEQRRELEKESIDMLKKVEEFSSEGNILFFDMNPCLVAGSHSWQNLKIWNQIKLAIFKTIFAVLVE